MLASKSHHMGKLLFRRTLEDVITGLFTEHHVTSPSDFMS